MPAGFHRLAIRDLTAARRWYHRQNPAAAVGFVAAVDAAVQRIVANPYSGSPSVGPYRWVQTGRFPYLIHYEPIDPTTVFVFAVGHASRRPGFWLGRTRRP